MTKKSNTLLKLPQNKMNIHVNSSNSTNTSNITYVSSDYANKFQDIFKVFQDIKGMLRITKFLKSNNNIGT